MSWAEQVLPELTGRHQQGWFDRLADELANFRAVRDWCHADPSQGQSELELAAVLGRYLWTRTPGQEARQWLAEALAAGPIEPSPARARALTWCGQLDYLHGEGESGRARLEQAVAVARVGGDPSLLCLTLRHVALWAADQPTAQVLLDEAAAMAGVAGDQRELALALSYSARLREGQGNLAEACELATHAIEAARAAGDALALTDGLLQLGHVSIRRRDYTTAAPALQEAFGVSERLGHRGYVTTLSRELAYLALEQRDLPLARARIRPSLETARASSNGADGLRSLELAAHLAVAESDYRHGVALFGAVAAWERSHHLRASTLWGQWSVPGAEAGLEACRAVLGEAESAAVWSMGQRLSLEAALDQALSRLGADPEPAELPGPQQAAGRGA